MDFKNIYLCEIGKVAVLVRVISQAVDGTELSCQ